MEPQAQFNWQQLCQVYMNRNDIPAKAVVDEIAKQGDFLNTLMHVVREIQSVANWEATPKLRELERQCREKIKQVSALTPKDYAQPTQAIQRTAKRAMGDAPAT